MIQKEIENLKLKVHFHASPIFGLANVGNTCYFNSGIQLLASSPEFIASLSLIFKKSGCSKERDSELFRMLVDSKNPSVAMSHYRVWWEVYALLSRSFMTEFEEIFRELRMRAISEGCLLSTETRAFISAHLPSAAVVQMRPIAPRPLLMCFAEAHPIFEGLSQQDTSEMVNQLLSSLDDVSRIDCFPHSLLSSLRTIGSYAPSRGNLAVIAFMHLTNMDNARRHCQTATFTRLTKQALDKRAKLEESSLFFNPTEELAETLISNPPTIPRIFLGPYNSLFKGYTLSTVFCHRCLSKSFTVQEFTSLTIDIPSDASRKRFAAENPDFVNRMRMRWHYDPERQVWTEKVISFSVPKVDVRINKRTPVEQKGPLLSGVATVKSIVGGALVFVAADCYRKGATFVDYASSLAQSKAGRIGLAVSAATMSVIALKHFASRKFHPSTATVVREAQERIRYISLLTAEPNLSRITNGLSEEERVKFISHCAKRIEDEHAVVENVFALFGEEPAGDSGGSGIIPHPADSSKSTFVQGIREMASKGCDSARSLLDRCQHNGRSCFSAGEIDYPLTLEECIAIHTSYSEICSRMDVHSNVVNHAKDRDSGFKCDNCCYGGTGWSEQGSHSLAQAFTTRVTSDVKVKSSILTLPQNLVVHLKRVRPPDEVVDEGGGNVLLQKIEDPVLFPNSSQIPQIILESGEVSIAESLLDMSTFSSDIEDAAITRLERSAERYCEQIGVQAELGILSKAIEGGIHQQDSKYRLVSVVNHHGDANGGHYTTFANRIVGMTSNDAAGRDRVWFGFNDSVVKEESVDTVFSESVSKGSVFLFQRVPSKNSEGASISKDIAQRILLREASTGSECVRIPRWWLIQAAIGDEPGPLWTRKEYVTHQGQRLFSPKPTQGGAYPDDWFYIDVPITDARLLSEIHGGDLAV